MVCFQRQRHRGGGRRPSSLNDLEELNPEEKEVQFLHLQVQEQQHVIEDLSKVLLQYYYSTTAVLLQYYSTTTTVPIYY